MVQNKSGRPPSFDRDHVITASMATFWRYGYAKTSLPVLEREVGVDRSTIYNSFGGKAGLHELALERYVELVSARLLEPLRRGGGGVDDVLTFLEALEAAMLGDEFPDGCLVLNDLATDGGAARADTYVQALRGALGTALRRAVSREELDQQRADQLSDVLLATIVGLVSFQRGGAQPEDLSATFSAARATVRAISGSG